MRVKKVNRYYCDFCKKASCAGGHMKKHEERCTMNPARVCGMCKLFDNEQKPMDDLLAILPQPETLIVISKEWGSQDCSKLEEALKDVFPKLRDLSGNCPACILSALRQKKIFVAIANGLGFDFKKECAEIWNDFNESQRRESEEY